MKICLVIPPSPFQINEKVIPNLGILYVASNLRRHHEVAVIDLSGGRSMPKVAADFYGITSTSPQIEEAEAVMAQIRAFSDSPVILGGSHATLASNDCKQRGFNIIVCGEADNYRYLVFKKRPIIHVAAFPENINDLVPARDLIDIKSYEYMLNGVKATPIISSRGCPYHCSFCSRNFPRKVRFRSPDSVIREAVAIKRMGFRGLLFYDDELLLDWERDFEIFSGLKKLGMIYRCFTRSNLVNESRARAMADTGCAEVLMGIESGSDQILRNVNKGTTRELNLDAIQLLKKNGIRVKAAIIVGLPGESAETLRETETFIEQAEPDDVDFSLAAVYPGSDIWNHPHRYDISFGRTGYLPYKGKPGEYETSVSTSSMTSSEILEARNYLEGKFKKKELLR